MADTENGSANTELSESSPAKKETASIDMQNSSQSLNPKETEPVKVNGTKRPSPECNLSSPNHQSPTNTAVNGRLVYVRRKADSELSKNNTNTKPNFSHPKKVSEQDEKNLEEPQIKDTRVCDSEAAKPSAPNSQLEDRVCNSEAAKPSAPNSQHEDRVCNSEAAKPSAPISLLEDRVCNSEAAKPSAPISQLEDSDNHRDVTAATPVVLPKKTNELHWEERFCRLQNLLKILDQSVHDGYVKMLQSLNSVELSRLAVELEKRSIHLSVQEVKEMQRVRQLDLLGRYNTNQQQNQKQEEEQGKPGEEKL